jgi:hypothetical protein
MLYIAILFDPLPLVTRYCLEWGKVIDESCFLVKPISRITVILIPNSQFKKVKFRIPILHLIFFAISAVFSRPHRLKTGLKDNLNLSDE